MKTLAQRLKEAREWKGWKQAQLALAADVSTGTIGNIESGARKSKGSIPQIADALGVNYQWLANEKGDMLAADNKQNHPPAKSGQALAAMTFDDVVRVIAQKLMEVDEATGRRAMGVLADLATDPQDYERLARATAAVIETGKRRAA